MKYLLLITMLLGVVACVQSGEKAETIQTKEGQTEYKLSSGVLFVVVRLGNCQYLYCEATGILTHKGDCLNPVHFN